MNLPPGVTDAMIDDRFGDLTECPDCGRLREYSDEDCECATEPDRYE